MRAYVYVDGFNLPAQRPAAIQLKRYANAEIRITQADLAASQLPSPIPGTTLRKPATW